MFHSENRNWNVMAAGSESEEDALFGLCQRRSRAVAEWTQARFKARNQSDSESDISISSVASEVLSDLSDSEEEERWNENADPVEVLPFTAATANL